MQTKPQRYRQHNPGHDYHEPGIYLITLVVGNRDRLLGSLNMDARHPGVNLYELGQILHEQWEATPAIQARRGHKVTLITQQVMPNHWHGVIQVHERMSWSLGDIIQAVKASMTSKWRKMTGYKESRHTAEMIRNMIHEERKAYYATRPRIERPLFDDDYDDTICLLNADGTYDGRHQSAMINYVNDNPRRAIIIKQNPDFMQRYLHIKIAGRDKQGNTIYRDYAIFGNLFLLRWARKVQVFCHRKARLRHLTEEERQKYGYTYPSSPDLITTIPYTDTQAYKQEHKEWVRKIMDGATVIVTPGISEGEKQMKNECLEKGYPLIHIQQEPITQYWKPEKQRFEACTNGTLLILAPWHPETLGTVNGIDATTDYSIFHNLNDIAAEICCFEGKAEVVR